MLLDKDMGIFTPAVIRTIKDYLAFPVYDCRHDRCMEKIPLFQVLDYCDAFHDDLFKKQFDLTKNTRINPLSYFSGLPSGDLVSDGEFDTYLCEQMFQEEFEFTVADDTSVAAFTNLRNSLGQEDGLGLLKFSKGKNLVNNLQAKLKKLNTFNLGDNKINSLANAGDIEIIDALFGNALESGLASRASMERLPEQVESIHNSLRAIQGKSLPASPGKECQSLKIISPARKISSPDDNTDESGFPYQEIKLIEKSSLIKLLENPCNLVIEEMPEGESFNHSSQYHMSKSKSNSVNKENLSSESKKEDSNILSSLNQLSTTIPQVKDLKIKKEIDDTQREIKDKRISEDYDYDSMPLASKLENKQKQQKTNKIHHDDVVRNLSVTINDNELSRIPVKNIDTHSQADDVRGVVGEYVKSYTFRSSDIDCVYEPTRPTHNRLISSEVQSPDLNLQTSEIFKSETGQSTADYHHRLSQNSPPQHKTKTLEKDELDRKIKTAKLKNIALDAERNSVNDDLEARIVNRFKVKTIGSQQIEDELGSEQIGTQSLIDDHRKNLMTSNASFKDIQSQLRGAKPFFLKSSAGQELLAKQLDISLKKSTKSNKSSFTFIKQDKEPINSSHTSIKLYNEPKAKGMPSKAVPSRDSHSIHNSQYFSSNQSKRMSSDSHPDALQSLQMLANNIMQNKAIAEPARQNIKKRQKASKFEELRQMIKPKNSEKNQNTQKQALKMQSKIPRTSMTTSVQSEELIDPGCLTQTKEFRKPEKKLGKRVVINPVLIKEKPRVNQNLRVPLFSLYGGNQANSSLNIQLYQIDNSPKATVTLQRLTQLSNDSQESPRLSVPSIRFRQGVYDRASLESKSGLLDIKLANSSLQRTLKALNSSGLFTKDSPQDRRSTSRRRDSLNLQVLATPKAHTKIGIAVENAKQQLYSSKALKSQQTSINPKHISTPNKP